MAAAPDVPVATTELGCYGLAPSTCSRHADAFVSRSHSARSCHRTSLPRPRVRQPTTYLGLINFHQDRNRFMHHKTLTPVTTPHSISIDAGRSPRPLRTPASSFKSPYRNRLESSSRLPLTSCARRFRSRLATIQTCGLVSMVNEWVGDYAQTEMHSRCPPFRGAQGNLDRALLGMTLGVHRTSQPNLWSYRPPAEATQKSCMLQILLLSA